MNPEQDPSENAGRSEISPLQETTVADWDELTRHLEAFVGEWEAHGFGPLLNDHLPPRESDLRRLVLIELIKVDLEFRHRAGGPVLRLEDYLAEHPELGVPDGLPVELIFEEYHVREATGETVAVDEYLQRFPERAEEIRQRFQLDDTAPMAADGAALSESFQPGEHVGDFYLMSALGAGAFGSVFLARQESMQRMVALKISRDRGTEGQTLAQLDHPNIVRVFDQNRLPDQNLRLLYMQFAAGGTLQAVIRESRDVREKTGRIVAECIAAAVDKTGVLSSESIPLKGGIAEKSWPEITCQLGVELALALSYAHGRGILHRDIKPANVLLEANGSAKLADFNISFSADTEGATPAAYFGGSLTYMSPEQLQAFHPHHETSPEDLDARADIYSLGVLLWELMYGRRPFDDECLSGSMTEILDGMVTLRCRGVPDSPKRDENAAGQQLHTILCRCLEPHAEDRFQSAAELAQELGFCLQPQVARLLHESRTGWRKWALAWPLVAFLITAVLPHVPAAVFNLVYNDQTIIAGLQETAADVQQAERMEDMFVRAVVGINAVAFSAGILICWWYLQPVRNLLRHDTPTGAECLRARIRALQLSRFVTLVGIAEWTIAGLAYPVVLHFVTDDGLHAKWQAHFFISLLVCGLVAAAYPFFLTATLTLKAFYPALLRFGSLRTEELFHLGRLSEQSAWSLYLAGGVPAVGIMILLTTQDPAESTFPLKVFSILGAVGFALALRLARALQTDSEALLESARMLRDIDEAAAA